MKQSLLHGTLVERTRSGAISIDAKQRAAKRIAKTFLADASAPAMKFYVEADEIPPRVVAALEAETRVQILLPHEPVVDEWLTENGAPFSARWGA